MTKANVYGNGWRRPLLVSEGNIRLEQVSAIHVDDGTSSVVITVDDLSELGVAIFKHLDKAKRVDLLTSLASYMDSGV